MKSILFIITQLLIWNFLTKAQSYDVLNYAFNGTPTYGIKIKTNIPYTNGSQMPNVRIEGYNYGAAKTIGVNLVWYIYDGNIIQYSASSFGGYTFPIKLSRENDKIVIFIDDRNYYNRFKVSVFAYGMGESSSWFSGWTTADEPINGTNTVDVPYTNSFSGNVGIGTSNPQSKLHVFGDGRFVPSGGLGSAVLNLMQSNNIDGYLFTIDNAVDGRMELRGNGGLIQTWFRGSNATLLNGSLSVNGQNIITTDNVEQFVIRRAVNTNHQLLIGRNAEYSYLQSVNQNTSFDVFCLNPKGGNIGIGTTNPGAYKLAVEGTIGARKLKVTQGSWADDVLKSNYRLMPITELEDFIQKNNHLPGVPSEKEVKGKDLDISETQTMLLKKIEELTLYILKLNNEVKVQRSEITSLKKIIKKD